MIILVLMIKNFILAKGADKRIRFFVKFSLCREYLNNDCDYDNDEKAEDEEIQNHIFYSQENPRWSRLPAAVSISVPTALSASAFLSSFIVCVFFFAAVSVPFINVINERKQSQKLPSCIITSSTWSSQEHLSTSAFHCHRHVFSIQYSTDGNNHKNYHQHEFNMVYGYWLANVKPGRTGRALSGASPALTTLAKRCSRFSRLLNRWH